MKLLYTHDNRFLVYNARNILEQNGIPCVLRNEFASSAAGDLSPFDTWLELWLLEPRHFSLAKRLIEQAFAGLENTTQWVCSQCGEVNEASFEICWNCSNHAENTKRDV